MNEVSHTSLCAVGAAIVRWSGAYADGVLGAAVLALPGVAPDVPLAGLDEDESLDVGAEEPESAVDAADVDVVDFLDPPESVL